MEDGITAPAATADEGFFTAKTLSKMFKVFSVLGIVVSAVLKWLGKMPEATVSEICMTWAAVYGIGAGTIDLNIILDKFTGGKK